MFHYALFSQNHKAEAIQDMIDTNVANFHGKKQQ